MAAAKSRPGRIGPITIQVKQCGRRRDVSRHVGVGHIVSDQHDRQGLPRRGALDAIADGLRTPGLKDQLLELEPRQSRLKELIEQAPPAAPRLHPRLSKVYRGIVADLHVVLARNCKNTYINLTSRGRAHHQTR